jgi:hypothetical protein
MSLAPDAVWQLYQPGIGWESCQNDFQLEDWFLEGHNNVNIRTNGDIVVANFMSMTVRDSHGAIKHLRRITSKTRPEVTYEWGERIGFPALMTWTPFTTDECEVIRLTEEAGRTKVRFMLIGNLLSTLPLSCMII